MKKIKLEKINGHLNQKLKDENFRKYFEFERAKMALAHKIAFLREKEHLKQIDLAKKMGVSQQFISQIETAQEKNITIDTLLKIVTLLGRGINISFPKISKRNSVLNIA